MTLPAASPYSWLMLGGIVVTLIFWTRLARRDERLLIIYVAALTSAFLGAKVVYLLAEGWMFWDDPQRWLIWATGKTILGALLGGYVGVEVAKSLLGYREATGDFFAFVAPFGIIMGRLGCLLHGCCPGTVCDAPAWYTVQDAHGVPRWPAVPVEMAFNVLMIAAFLLVRRWRQTPGHEALLRGQLFHLYLLAYGIFRFAHEFLRATPRWHSGGVFSGYQVAALAVAGLGAWGYWRRGHRDHSAVMAAAEG